MPTPAPQPASIGGDEAFWRAAALYRTLAAFPPTRGFAKRRFADLGRALPSATALPGVLAGIPVTLDLRDPCDRDAYLFGGNDPRGVGAIVEVMKRLGCRTAWDVGANRGNHTAFMRQHCQRLFAFEPNPAEFIRVETLFAGDAGVVPLNVGLSFTDGVLPFHIQPDISGGSSFELEGRAANFEAKVRTGDAVASEHGLSDIDFLKIDVEGHETAVLRGLADVIRTQRPVIILELLEANNRPDAGLEALMPGYRFFGNRIGFVSSLIRTAYSFCPFEYGRAYMSALFVPEEKLGLLADLLP